jgi:hypothetical protein
LLNNPLYRVKYPLLGLKLNSCFIWEFVYSYFLGLYYVFRDLLIFEVSSNNFLLFSKKSFTGLPALNGYPRISKSLSSSYFLFFFKLSYES